MGTTRISGTALSDVVSDISCLSKSVSRIAHVWKRVFPRVQLQWHGAINPSAIVSYYVRRFLGYWSPGHRYTAFSENWGSSLQKASDHKMLQRIEKNVRVWNNGTASPTYWQVWQYGCSDFWQISERSDNCQHKSRGLATSYVKTSSVIEMEPKCFELKHVYQGAHHSRKIFFHEFAVLGVKLLVFSTRGIIITSAY